MTMEHQTDQLLPPPGCVLLGIGGTFITGGAFTGHARVREGGAWGELSEYLGESEYVFYAAPIGSEIAIANGYITPEEEADDDIPPYAGHVPPEPEEIALTQEQDGLANVIANPLTSKATDLSKDHDQTPERPERMQLQGVMPPAPCPVEEGNGTCPTESDPHGIPQHAPGAKNDAGKPEPCLLFGFSRALEGVSDVASYGATKYARNGWEHVADGQWRYMNAAGRHLIKCRKEYLCPESGLPHVCHLLWNVIAAVELFLRSREQPTKSSRPDE